MWPGVGHDAPVQVQGTSSDGTWIRCGTVVNRNGFGIGVQIGGDGAAHPVPGDLAGLSDAELLRRAGDGVTRRLREG